MPESRGSSRTKASDPLLDRLLCYKRKKRLRWTSLSRQVGVSDRTLRRWVVVGGIPRSYVSKISRILGAELKAPPDFFRPPSLEEVQRAFRFQRSLGVVDIRKALAYAAGWLVAESRTDKRDTCSSFHFPAEGAQRALVQLMAGSRLPVASVQLEVRDKRLHYSCFQHLSNADTLLCLEGVADWTGFCFCLEFLNNQTTEKAEKIQKLALKRAQSIFSNGGKTTRSHGKHTARKSSGHAPEPVEPHAAGG